MRFAPPMILRFLLPLLLSLPPLAAQAQMPPPTGPVILTVGGTLPEGNIAPSGEGGLFARLDVSFATGVGFDATMLTQQIQQGRVTLPAYGPWQDVTFTGPYLSMVMAAAGALGQPARLVGLDGYQVEIPWDNIAALRPIVATHVNGRPLALGGYGPTAIVYPDYEDAALQEELEALQVWALAYIGVP